MAIIAFTGRAGSGKDTVAKIVQELYPEMDWRIKGFADKLREVASLLTGIPAEEMKKQEVKERFLGEEWWYYHLGYTNHKISYHEAQKGGYGEMDFDDLTQLTVRSFLQKIGTDAIRNELHENAWVNALMCDYTSKSNGDDLIVGQIYLRPLLNYPNWLIIDCRFPNELEAIKSRQGTCVRIVRPDNPYPQSNHESETALDGVELLTIINDGSLDQLCLRVKEVFDPIVKNIGK